MDSSCYLLSDLSLSVVASCVLTTLSQLHRLHGDGESKVTEAWIRTRCLRRETAVETVTNS